MKREDMEILVRQSHIPWVTRLPETRPCLMVIRDRHMRAPSGCANLAGWAFTADASSRSQGGVYCWSHLMVILSRGEEQVRVEDLLRTWDGV